jgi:hypothetical protein
MPLILIILVIVIITLCIKPILAVKLHGKYKSHIQIIFPLLIIGFGLLLTTIILKPIKFEQEKNYRSGFVKKNLTKIRSAQLAFKEKKNRFASSFEELIPVIKKDSFILTQRTDTMVEFYNTIYREMQFKDTMLIDTLGKVSILDSLFQRTYNIDSLKYIPFSDDKIFDLKSGTINKSKINVHVFEVKANKEDYLNNLNKDLIQRSSKDLILGSMTEASLNGNWQ